MRWPIFILLIFSYLQLFSKEVNDNSERQIEAFFSYATFYSPVDGPYIETYLSFTGASLQYKKLPNNQFQSTVEVTYIFNKNKEVVAFKKFKVMSPEIANRDSVTDNFLDLQRISIPNGTYILEIIIKDENASTEPFSSAQFVHVDFEENKLNFSDLALLESFKPGINDGMLSKNGVELVPYISNFYPDGFNKLCFYAEVYNANQQLGDNQKYLIKYFIRKYESKQVLPNFVGYLRRDAVAASVLLKEFDITHLPTGNYELVVQAIDRNNELIKERSLFIQRSNPNLQLSESEFEQFDITSTFVSKYNSRDTLLQHIKSLSPIAEELESTYIDRKAKELELDMMQKFFYAFWKKRNEIDPEQAWVEYQKKLAAVEREYGTTIRRGFETDRGRIYLKHGPPNSIVARYNEPTAYPYEIWHYYKIDVRSDARFIFYNPNIVTNDFELLHSNVYNEIRDYRWKFRLMRRGAQEGDIDAEGIINEQFGNEAEDFFTNPR